MTIILTNYVAKTVMEKITTCAAAKREFSLHKHGAQKERVNVRALSSCQLVCGSQPRNPSLCCMGSSYNASFESLLQTRDSSH